MRGAVEVRPAILKRLVRLGEGKPLAHVVLKPHVITSTHLGDE